MKHFVRPTLAVKLADIDTQNLATILSHYSHITIINNAIVEDAKGHTFTLVLHF
jgi:hypothetical protein